MLSTIITVAFVLAVAFLCWGILKAMWRSKLFWLAALALTVALFPVTAGISPFALFALLFVRFWMIHRVIVGPGGAQ